MSWLLREVATGSGTVETPDVSVCIPALNGGERLADAVNALLGQETNHRVEILIADSGSTDGSFKELILANPVLRGFIVAPRRFNHGLVRNEMTRLARAPLVAFLSQDAVPNAGFLSYLVAAFSDPRVVGAYARQLPRPGADPLLRATLERWTPSGTDITYQEESTTPWEARTAEEKMRCARFDNVASMARRSALLSSPFKEVEFGEDILWGAAMIQSGHRLAYVPKAEVEHSHEPLLLETFRRNRAAHQQARRDFGLDAVPSLAVAARALISGLPSDARDGGVTWAIKGLPRRAAALAGQWLGSREGSE
jgi:rhamnosyltransferase